MSHSGVSAARKPVSVLLSRCIHPIVAIRPWMVQSRNGPSRILHRGIGAGVDLGRPVPVQASSGGRITSAHTSAVTTLTDTTIPKSESNGKPDSASTPKPAAVVSPDATKARPMLVDAVSTAWIAPRPSRRSSR